MVIMRNPKALRALVRLVQCAITSTVALSAIAVTARAQTSVLADSIYEVYAIRYASIPFRVSGLISGADTSRRIDIAMMVWLLRSPGGRNILVDAGFYRQPLMSQWKPADFMRPDSAVALAGIKPADVTDIIISHIHWDHFDGADLFPNAKVWIQREEVEHHIDSTGAVVDRTINRLDAAMLHELRKAGRLQLVNGDAQSIAPGIKVYTGGKHTFASQYVGVRTAQGVAVVASDNAYLYENFEKHVPIAQTLDATSNLAAQDRMRTLASNARLIVPGHDPGVFRMFELVNPRIARIR
jgi:glyoxylase-like metal-dependent hydrolase (beta-lactamase superfamily II)